MKAGNAPSAGQAAEPSALRFIRVIEDDQASGRARELFDADLAKDGYVWNLTRVLAIRPQALDAWQRWSAIRRRPIPHRSRSR